MRQSLFKNQLIVVFMGFAICALLFVGCAEPIAEPDWSELRSERAMSSSSQEPDFYPSGMFDWLLCVNRGDCGFERDTRDEQEYKWVKIKGVRWFAKNLNFHRQEFQAQESSCYGNNPISCNNFGRLYHWNLAMGYQVDDGALRQRGVCPSGWHIPNHTEWNILREADGNLSTALRLRTENRVGSWLPTFKVDGQDSYGFSAEPAGVLMNDGYKDKFLMTCFVVATTNPDENPAFMCIHGDDANAFYRNRQENSNYLQQASVRCIEGDGMPPTWEQSSSSISSSSFSQNPYADLVTCRNMEYCGSFEDYRDNTIYPWVRIGSQWWMAKNLNIGQQVSSDVNQINEATIEKYCYNNESNHCNDFGGLYQWHEAMRLESTCAINSCPIASSQGICPDGWRMPNVADMATLYLTAHPDRFGAVDSAGSYLKANDIPMGGLDRFLFNAKSAGLWNYSDGTGYFDPSSADYWLAEEGTNPQSNAAEMYFSKSMTMGMTAMPDKRFALHVRCMRDAAP